MRNTHKTRRVGKKARLVLIILSGLIVLLLIHPIIPTPMIIDTTAMEIRMDDPTHLIEHTISIRGMYFHNFYTRNSRFRGRIEISGYPQTHNGRTQSFRIDRIHLAFGNLFGRGSLWYFQADNIGWRIPEYELNALVMAEPRFRQMVIMVTGYEGSFHGGAYHPAVPIIVLHATSRQDAYERASLVHPVIFIPAGLE